MTAYHDLARLGVATVYEAAGRQGLIDCEFRSLIPGSRYAGPARTIACGQDDNLMVHAAIERIQPGDVVVITMPEPRPVALIGDLLVTQIKKRRAGAILNDASVRDVDALAKMGLPIWTRYVRVRGADKVRAGAIDVPVTIGGATIHPGDIVFLDDDGACVLPSSRVSEIIIAARDRERNETRNRARYENGEFSYDLNGLRRVIEKR